MKNNRKGFTLVELIIVIVVIAILTAILIPTIFSLTKKAKISNDVVTAHNLNAAISLSLVDINDYDGLKKAIGDIFGVAFLETLSPESSTYGYHFWFDNETKQVILSTVEDLEDKGEEAIIYNCPNSNIVYGYTLLDATGSDIASLLSGISNICSKSELRALVDSAIKMYENGDTYLENLIDYLSYTTIINSQGSFRFDDLSNIVNLYFPSDYVSLGTQILYTYNIGTNTTDIHKVSLGYPIIGDGVYGQYFEIKDTMYFGTQTLVVEEDCDITIYCDLNSVEDFKNVFAAEATNAYIALANDLGTKYVLVDDKILDAVTGETVFEGLEYSDGTDFNYKFPYTEKVSQTALVEKNNLTNKTTSESYISIENTNVSAVIPEGVKVEDSQLTLSVTPMEISESNVVLTGYATKSIDVHIEGVSKSNNVPIIINIGSVLPKGLNSSAVKLYHIENDEPVLMQRISHVDDNSSHNTYSYNPNTGEVTVALKSFSEIMAKVDQSNKWGGDTAKGFAGGSGNTADDPYLIETVEQLAYLAQQVNLGYTYEDKYFRLENNLVINDWDLTKDDIKEGMKYSEAQDYCAKDFSSSATNDPAFEQKDKAYKTWVPIGNGSKKFSGIFDGNNKSISGLYKLYYVDPMDKTPMGLFGWVHDATIKNLTIEDSFIYTYGGTVGLVTGYASGNTTIENVTVKDNFVTSYNYPLGGIVGYMYGMKDGDHLELNNVKIDSSNLLESLWGTYDSQVGGLVGRASANTKITIRNCQVWPELSLYNDCCANYQWFAYRYSGMLVGYVTASDRADYLTNNVTCDNVLIKYGEWTDQYYCELKSLGKGSYNGEHAWKYTRIAKDQVIRDENGLVIGCDETKTGHRHEDYPLDEDNCAINKTFNQLFGGGQGVYGETPDQFTALKTNAGKTAGITVERYTSEEPETPDYSNSFECLFVNADKYLYRVGNQNTITLGTLFKDANGTNIDSSKVSVEFENKQGTDATPTPNASDWTNGTIKFSGSGVIRVNLVYYGQVVKTLNLEVIDAKNIDSMQNLSNFDAVLVKDCSIGETTYTISDGHTLYGNGFTISSVNVGLGLSANLMGAGYIALQNGHLENIKIICALYPRGYLYSNSTSYGEAVQDSNNRNDKRSDFDSEGKVTKARYNYQYSAVTTTGKCSISNCYIEGARNNILITPGSDGTIIYNTTVAYGSLANIHITDTSGTIIFKDLSTIQDVFQTNLPDSVLQDGNHNNDGNKKVFGLGILVGDNETKSYPTIKIEGDFSQNNWVKKGTTVSSSISNTIISSVFSNNSPHKKTINGEEYVNIGIVYMTTITPTIDDSDFINSSSYQLTTVSLSLGSGKTYSYVGDADSDTIIIPAYEYIANEKDKRSDETKTIYLTSDLSINNVYDKTLQQTIATINKELEENDIISISVGNFIISRMGKTYYPTRYELDGVEIQSNHVINITDSSKYELHLFGKTSGYYDKNLNFILDEQDFEIIIRINIISKAIDKPQLIFGSNYDSYDNKFKSGNGDWNGVWNALNDVQLRYYSFSRNSYLIVPLEYFISGSNVKGTRIWTGTYDGCTLVLESTTLLHSKKNDYGYFIISNGVLYLTCDNNVSSGTSVREANIKYSITDANSNTVQITKYRKIDRASATTKSVSTGSTYIYRLDPGIGSISQYSFGPFSNNQKKTLSEPSCDGYEFLGWYDQPSGGTRKDTNLSYTTTASNVVLYAHWLELVNHTITLDVNGGYSDENCITSYSGISHELPSCSNNGYWFVGWFNGETRVGGIGDIYEMPNNDVTLTAHWSPIYTITYDMTNGGTVSPTSNTYEGSAISLPTPTPGSQPTFEGWYTAASGGTRIGGAKDSYSPTANITLYAQWSTNIPVTFNANGGTCITSNSTYDGVTPITLPTATRSGYQFNGWYTASSGGTKRGNAGATYTPSAAETLYAQWTAYTVTYDANGGSVSPSSASGVVTLPTPSRTGYTFNGWYTATSGGTKIGNGGASYTLTSNITIYAQWTVNSYKITITTSNSSTAVTVNGTTVNSGGSVAYNSVVKVVLSYSQNNSKTFTIKQGNTSVPYYTNEACTLSTTSTAAGTYYFKMPAGDVTINSSSKSGSCFTGDTLITLADGSQKEIQYLTGEEYLMVWDFENGELTTTKISAITNHGYSNYEMINLFFENNKNIKIIETHAFFVVEENMFVNISSENIDQYLNKHFIFNYENEIYKIKLINYEISYLEENSYSIFTEKYVNAFANSILTLSPSALFLYPFDINEFMKFDEEKRNNDIEQIGLLSYDEFKTYFNGISEELFYSLGGQYIKISVAKGISSFENILNYAKILSTDKIME